MREYERTHPWLKFSADLRSLSTGAWVKLGECQSKCEHIRDAPILPDTAKEFLQVSLIKGVVATTAIEGNTLTEKEVKDYLEGKMQPSESREYQVREVDNIIRACNGILSIIKRGETPPLDVGTIKTLNGEVLHDLIMDDHVTPGELRKVSVGVLGYRGAPAEDCEYLLEQLCDWLNSSEFDALNNSMPFVAAIIKSVLAHIYIAWIHPFGDGNGRTARLIEFIILISSGIPATAAHLLSNHYNLTRTRYYRELKRASESKGDIIPFLEYAIQGLLDGLREQVDAIQKQQWEVVWRYFVFSSLKGNPGKVRTRKRKLIFALSDKKEPLSVKDIGEIPLLLDEYRNKFATLKNDINELVKEGLFVRDNKKIRARFEAISGLKNIVANINH